MYLSLRTYNSRTFYHESNWPFPLLVVVRSRRAKKRVFQFESIFSTCVSKKLARNILLILHNWAIIGLAFTLLRFQKIYFLIFNTIGGVQIVLFLRPKGTVLLRKPYYFGTDLVLKSWFMTFGFSKSPFFAQFQATSIFETKKVIIWFHFETFIKLFITNFDNLTRF